MTRSGLGTRGWAKILELLNISSTYQARRKKRVYSQIEVAAVSKKYKSVSVDEESDADTPAAAPGKEGESV